MYALDLSKPAAKPMATRAMSSSDKVPLLQEVVAAMRQAAAACSQIDRLMDNELLAYVPFVLAKAEDALAYYEWMASDDASADILDEDMKAGRSTRSVSAVAVVEPTVCRMRAVICRSVTERAIVEYTGSETDDRYTIVDALLPQIPDTAWRRSTENSYAYVDSLECCDGDESGGMDASGAVL